MAGKKPSKSPKLDSTEDEDSRENSQRDLDESQQKALESIVNIQHQIDKLNEQASEEILHVEQKYNQLRKPHYQNRAELAVKIPEFWYTTLINHPTIAVLMNEEDERALQYLENLTVDEYEDVKSGFKIGMHFKSNPYFENSVLSKEFILDSSGENTVTGTVIKWKPGQDLTNREAVEIKGRKRTHEEPQSFFCWFVDCDSSNADDIAEMIKDDVWPNPVQYFLSNDVSVDEVDEDDEEDEVEEEEEEEEDEEGDVEQDELVDLEDEDEEDPDEDG